MTTGCELDRPTEGASGSLRLSHRFLYRLLYRLLSIVCRLRLQWARRKYWFMFPDLTRPSHLSFREPGLFSAMRDPLLRTGACSVLVSLLSLTAGCELAVGDAEGFDGSSLAGAAKGSSVESTGAAAETGGSSETGAAPEDPNPPAPQGSSTGAAELPPEDPTEDATSESSGDPPGASSDGSDETADELCTQQATAIPDAGGPIRLTLDRPEGGAIAAVAVRLNIEHLYIGDLTVDIEHAGQSVRLFDRDCGASSDLLLTYEDGGEPFACASAASGGSASPAGSLSDFDGVDAAGEWVVVVEDAGVGLSGSAREVCVELSL